MNAKKSFDKPLSFKEEQSRKYILRKREEFEANKEMKTFFYDGFVIYDHEEQTNKHGD